MWRTAFIAAAVLLMTALPSFGHGIPAGGDVARYGAIGATMDHAGNARISTASCPDTGCSDKRFAACADVTATHCLICFHPPEAGQSVVPDHAGIFLFGTAEAQLRGISPAATTPPPRI